MNNLITLVLVLDTNLQVPPFPVPCSAHQVVSTISTLGWFDLAAAVCASVLFIFGMSALAGCGTCASAVVCIVAGLLIPERLVGAELRIDRLPCGSCSIELVAGVRGMRTAPSINSEAVVVVIHICA